MHTFRIWVACSGAPSVCVRAYACMRMMYATRRSFRTILRPSTELIPRPARACADPPLYLRLRMGKPNGKSMPLPSYVMSYGKNKLRPEFWFSIPKNRTDELYRFLNTWVPQLYGELDENAIKERGFELIQHDTEWIKGGQNKVRSGSFYELIAFIAAHIYTHTHTCGRRKLACSP